MAVVASFTRRPCHGIVMAKVIFSQAQEGREFVPLKGLRISFDIDEILDL
jgi:hypothetical protein